jgi:pantetheine-phosphate adenylyltransferase
MVGRRRSPVSHDSGAGRAVSRCKTPAVTAVLYAGSFDPFHLGHLNVVEQAAGIFDEVIVGVLGNPRKQSGLFAIADRVRLAAAATGHLRNVRCVWSRGLTIDLARSEGADFLVRSGHKESGDESTMAAMNEKISGLRTVFAAADPRTRTISSGRVRDLMSRGDTEAAVHLVPPVVGSALEELAWLSSQRQV